MKKIVIIVMGLMALSAVAFAEISTKACQGCHGQEYNKKALGKSKVVSEMSFRDINASLRGYQDGTYGGPMKGLMKGQVAKYSDADVDAFSATIGK